MNPSIVAIGTAVPPTRLAQHDVREVFATQPGIGRLTQRLVHAAFDASAIEYRHTVLSGLLGDPGDGLSVRHGDVLLSPPTSARNAEYRRLVPALFAEASRQALSDAGLDAAAVTHVITVSCTGLFAPGPDMRLVRDLGLSPNVERYHHGFVGCAAAVPALRAAHRIAVAQPGSVVLVASAELCSLHLRASSDPEQIVAASLFADGAAAAIVTSAPSTGVRLELDTFATALTSDGEDDMTWTIGDEGFEMRLSAEVPRIVGREVRAAASDLLDVDAWAVHPGGRSVLDRVAAGLELTDAQMAPSREVLRDYGNMSSATILFILRRLLHDDSLGDADIGALAFGPGLTVESARLHRRTAAGA
ncbi:type III polyketide synthase [Microbacterium sp. cx-55]|uniref:type III polyketide synthase n=1 Tax=Microbacterium sp. cx-55 TaxID=2875948 RepID=UPI001CBBD261|nr:type III polyketide synthase [Microbacterium sp. cx-55]MBZ4488419.1 type III polyketide synthase [Microbacterium sp. cx-55]UGB35070.1 type III polyketide synthase [Microbacterium sp. cx-55]